VLRWSARARADLKAIHDYIRKDSPLNAKAVVLEFLDRASQLTATPRVGRIVPERGDAKIREIPVHSWRLIYLVRGEDVFVLTLIHKRRLPTPQQLRE
jgi:addiction module RelE/StbE family toxin